MGGACPTATEDATSGRRARKTPATHPFYSARFERLARAVTRSVVVCLAHRARCPSFGVRRARAAPRARAGPSWSSARFGGSVPASGVGLRWGRSAQDQPAWAPTVRWGSPCVPALGPGATLKACWSESAVQSV